MGIAKLKRGEKPTQPRPKSAKDEKYTGKKRGGQK